MKGINQGLRVAAPERLWSDLVPDADGGGAPAALHEDAAGLRDPQTPTSQL